MTRDVVAKIFVGLKSASVTLDPTDLSRCVVSKIFVGNSKAAPIVGTAGFFVDRQKVQSKLKK